MLAGIAALPDHAVVDRLVRGRAWIPVLGVMLAGIVAMQVEVLKLGASTGRSIQLGNQLQAHNENLRVAVAALADDQRIEQLAAKQGMVMPAPSDIGFLSGGPGNLLKAVNAIHAPSLATFLNNTTVNGAVTTAQVTTPNPTAVAASSGGTGSSSSSVGSSGSTGSSGSAGSSGASATALAGGTTSGSGSGSSSGSGSGATATAAAPVGVAGQSHP